MAALKELMAQIKSGDYDDKFLDICRDESVIDYQRKRYYKALKKFADIYNDGDVNVYSAPGRSEVMGNHTDHQHGEILAASINLDTIGVAQKTDTGLIKLVSGEFTMVTVDTANLSEPGSGYGKSKSLIEGVCRGFIDRGLNVGGFNAYVTSDVLIGAGLSSSAAYETLLGTILSDLYNDGKVSSSAIAVIGQFAENVYFGKPCGLMDQMACATGNLVHVDFSDTAHPFTEKINYDLSENGYSLCITDTKGSHADLTDEYAAIPAEMKTVAALFGKDVLLGISMKELLNNAPLIREKAGDRALLRAMHFVSENERVGKGVKALKDNDTKEFLKLVKLSGHSSFEYLQNVYSSNDVSNQNISVALAVSDSVLDGEEESFRVHGGGFAGTVQAFVKNENVGKYRNAMEKVFGEGSCHILKIRKYGGIKVM